MRRAGWQNVLSALGLSQGGALPRVPARQSTVSRHGASGKMLVPLLGVLSFLLTGVTVFAVVMKMQETERRQAKERELQIALAEKDELKTQLEESQQAKVKVDDELARVRKDLAQTNEQLAKAVEAQVTLSKSVEAREQEITRLTKELDHTRDEGKAIASQLQDLQTERESLKQQLTGLQQAKGELESKVLELSERPTVELEKVKVTGNQPGAEGTITPTDAAAGPAKASEGQVVVINREYDFIVMNLGKNHGLSIGQEFQVVRGNEVLGRVKVEKVYDELSAAAILPDSKKDVIREGDSVKAL